jgi:hypothetical protein
VHHKVAAAAVVDMVAAAAVVDMVAAAAGRALVRKALAAADMVLAAAVGRHPAGRRGRDLAGQEVHPTQAAAAVVYTHMDFAGTL